MCAIDKIWVQVDLEVDIHWGLSGLYALYSCLVFQVCSVVAFVEVLVAYLYHSCIRYFRVNLQRLHMINWDFFEDCYS